MILEEMIDKKWWAEDYRFSTREEAEKKAKKLCFKDRKDHYVAELVERVELNPDVKIETTKLLPDNTEKLENKDV